MLDAGTPCPTNGKIGESAKEIWKKKGRIKEEEDTVVQTKESAKEQPIRESGKKED
jgi:hypothetical protein